MPINMESSFIQLDDLPDELLMAILKKLFNAEVLYSFVGSNYRLSTIAHDSFFTSHITLMRNDLDDFIHPLADPIIDRFCFEILPKILHKIEWLDLEASSMERILATNYPNLHGVGIYNISIRNAQSLFIDESPLVHILKKQISSLVINIINRETQSLTVDLNKIIFENILTIFTKLQCLNYSLFSRDYQPSPLLISLTTVTSSTLLELSVCVENFIDCLCLLDGRFNNLHTIYVNIRQIDSSALIKSNKEKLHNLRCFSLHCQTMFNAYDELIVPLLYRMSNLEKLHLNFCVTMNKIFIDGSNLKTNIINYMPQLDIFTFDIRSSIDLYDGIALPSNEDIQRTFQYFKNNQIISCVDRFEERQRGHCHIYSYPYQLKYYNCISNNFPGGLFKCVREIFLFDERPFEHEFFVRISLSFPFMKKLGIRNSKPQNKKLCKESNNDNQDLPAVEYPHLANLSLILAHDDYVEQFLTDTKICLTNNVHLSVTYPSLKRVTHNFTRNTTRVNCGKLNSVCIDCKRIRKYVKDYFPHALI